MGGRVLIVSPSAVSSLVCAHAHLIVRVRAGRLLSVISLLLVTTDHCNVLVVEGDVGDESVCTNVLAYPSL